MMRVLGSIPSIKSKTRTNVLSAVNWQKSTAKQAAEI